MADRPTNGVDQELLADLCRHRGVDVRLVRDLLEIERDFQMQASRQGISDRLRRRLQAELPEE